MHINEFHARKRLVFRFIQGVLPIIFWALLIYSFDDAYTAGLTVLSAAVHEFGHLFCAYCISGIRAHVHGRLPGLVMQHRGTLPYRKEMLLYSSGPLANLLTSLLSVVLAPRFGQPALDFALINCLTAVSNLIPVKGYDGYGILRNVLASKCSFSTVSTVTESISLAFTVAMCFISLYFIERYDGGYWVFAVFLFALLSTVKRGVDKRAKEI